MQTSHFYKFGKNVLIFIILSVTLPNRHSTGTGQGRGGGGIVFGAAALTADTEPASTTPARLPPPRVRLNKCCHYGQNLDNTQACVTGSSELWIPIIFLISRKQYYEPRGKSPKFITFEENVRPVVGTAEQPGCTVDELELFTGSGNIVLFSNGSLFLSERAQLIEPQRFCIDRESALVCFPKNKTEQPLLKVRKCCGKYLSYNGATKSCTSATESSEQLKLPINESIYQTIYGFPECHEASTSYAIAGDWKLTQLNNKTGHLQLQQKNLSTSDYCLEHMHEGSTAKTVKVFTCLHHFSPDAPANSTKFDPTSTTSDHLQVAALNIGIVISVVFLAATLIASYLMPSVHHVLHWRCQIYYVFCLFVGDLLLAYTQLSSSIELGSVVCLLFASAMHFFFLSAFFWLNTMCFNIWWTFRDFRPSSLERNQELLRLRLYSAYAWGIPLLISAIAACVDHLPDTQLLRPGFGVRSCWFSGEHLSIFAYFFGPVGILLCSNIILFVSTTHQLTCGLWKRDDVKSTTEKTALGKVCLKLVVVMGVTWIADIISWLVGGPHYVWFFTDLINALQGVFIFIVVGCQPQVWSACKRFCCPRSRQEITNTTNGVQHSSSSQGLPSLAACGAEITQNTSINTTIGGNHTQAKIPMETVC